MLDKFLACVIYVLEALLFVLLLRRGEWKRHFAVSTYLISLLAVDAALRPYFFCHYGLNSYTYGYCYWLSDIVLALEAFGLTCFFFRRACARDAQELWRLVRIALVVVFVLVAYISYYFIAHNYDHVQRHGDTFIYEFEQNLYFACLVLNTFLFVVLQGIERAEQELELFVCGMGIQFAGPTASLALVHVTHSRASSYSLLGYIMPVCTLMMLLVWLYAVTTTHKEVAREARVAALAEAGS